MKIFIPVITIFYLFVFNVPSSFLYHGRTLKEQNNSQDSLISITISVVGDLMCHSPQFENARVSKDSFDFNPPFREVKSLLSKADLTFGNFETVTAGKENGNYTGYPKFNSPASYISALVNSGFDLLTIANNHMLDRGMIGVIRTISEIRKNNISYTGAFLSQSDRDSIRVFNLKGIKLAVLAYSYGTNGNPVPQGKNYLINLIDYDLIKNDITKAREKGAEIVLVNFHFGDEYKREPNDFQKEVVDKTVSLGADIIIGGHPHVIQPVKLFKTQNALFDTGLVAYSMGNYFSNQSKRYTDAGIILNLLIYKNLHTNKISINNITFIPTWVYKGNAFAETNYLIMSAIYDSLNSSYLNISEKYKMEQAYDDTREIIKKYLNSNKIQEYTKNY